MPEKELARQVFQTPLNIPKSLRSPNYSPQGSVSFSENWQQATMADEMSEGIQATIVLFD